MSGSHREVNRASGRGRRFAELILAVAAGTVLAAVLFVHFHPAGSPTVQAAADTASPLQASFVHGAATPGVIPASPNVSSRAPAPAPSPSPSARIVLHGAMPSLPAGSPAAQAVSSTAPTSLASTSRVAATLNVAPSSPNVALPSSSVVVVPTLTYVVGQGDTVTVVAAWFQTHGYGQFTDEMKSALAAALSRMHPGQQITISPSGITTSG